MASKQNISNWNNYPKVDSEVCSPEDIPAFVKEEKAPNVIARGNGRCYGDASLNEHVVSMLHHKQLHSFDAATGIVSCDAGLMLSELLETILPKGWFLPVTPGTKFITVGGAIAADIHGKDHFANGTFGQHVKSFELLVGEGKVIHCSPTKNREIFFATLGGMGLTGIILRCDFACIPAASTYIEEEFVRADSLKELMRSFEENEDCPYRVAWIDFTANNKNAGRSLLLLGRFIEPNKLPAKYQSDPFKLQRGGKKNIPFHLPDFALSKMFVRMFNKWVYASHKEKTIVADYDTYFYPLDGIHNWNRIYGKRGFIQYQLVLPLDKSLEGLEKIIAKIRSNKYPPFLTVLKRFGKAEAGRYLSFPMEGYTLALDLKMRPGLLDFLKELDAIVLEFGGRVYLAKDARMDGDTFRKMYPDVDDFIKVVKQVNPGVFRSHLAKRLGLYDAIIE
jgi:decaprenylphospho-beta-D-ribofuranose 2-oxidase